VLAVAGALIGWFLVTTVFYTGGSVNDWVAGGWGFVVLLYAAVLMAAGIALVRGRRSWWIGLAEFSAALCLLAIAFLAVEAALGGGAVLFYLPLACVAVASAVLTLWVGVSILRR